MAWISRIRALFKRNNLTHALDEELEFHLAMREQWNVDQGMPQQEARRDARLRFGNTAVWRERMSEIDLLLLPQTIWQDLRYGARMLVRNAGFTAAAVVALAVGIGVNTAAFTAYKVMFARSLDARDPSTMVNMSLNLHSGAFSSSFSYPDFEAYRDNLRTFSGVIAAANPDLVALSGTGDLGGQRAGSEAVGSLAARLGLISPSALRTVLESAMTYPVSENYFSVLGVAAVRGRTFESLSAQEIQSLHPALISENYWHRRFDDNPSVMGKSVRLNGVPFTIIGITPRDFVGTNVAAPDFWVPMSLAGLLHPGDHVLTDRENQCCRMFGRLAVGVRRDEAQAEMDLLANHLRTLHDPHSEQSKPLTASVWPGSPFSRKMGGDFRLAILLIMVAVGMVLVISCANVACLQLARATSRQNELRMRLSLGASRGRLIRQLLTESALLAMIAGVAALLVTWAVLKGMANIAAEALPAEYGSFVVHVTPDLGIFAYVFAISLAAGILFGLAPALEGSRSALPSSMKANSGTSPARGRRLRNLLIGAQVAISLVLMIAGSMLIRSSVHTLNMGTGYDGKQVVNLELQFPQGTKYTAESKIDTVRLLRARIAALPGVTAVTIARPPDGGGIRSAAVSVDGENPSERNTIAYPYYTFVEENYFQTLGIPLALGRSFHSQAGSQEAAVVLSESAAKHIFPGVNPIGRSLRMSTAGQRFSLFKGEVVPDGPTYQVVGVARDTRGVMLDGGDSEQVFVPMPGTAIADHPMLIRTRLEPETFISAIVPVIASVDPELGASVITLDAMLKQTPPFIVSGLAASIATTVGLLGLVLASMGIYGTVSYMVVLRNREVGIRMALGAKRGDVLTLMLRESIRPVLGGLAAGLMLAVGASYLLRAILYGLGIFDALSFFGVAGFFLAIALLASFLPSRRAMRVDPMVALRYE